MSVLDEINRYLPLKQFGGRPWNIPSRKAVTDLANKWGMGMETYSLKYVSQAVKNFQTHLTEELGGRYTIPAKADNPFHTDYYPETNTSGPLAPKCS